MASNRSTSAACCISSISTAPSWRRLTHVLGRYAKQAADDRNLTACLVAWGTNMGLGRMGDISDIGYQALGDHLGEFYPAGNLARGQ